MFKKLVLATTLATGLSAAGCYGSMGAFNSLHDWNGHATGSKVGNSAVNAVLWIIPVYELLILGDVIIFNTIEFATGTNPFK